jgi:acylphosphatase
MAPHKTPIGRRYAIQGRVQGVGFRDFVQREARRLNVTGYVKNLSDGSVLVCALGLKESIEALESALYQGPRWSEVRGVSKEDLALDETFEDFRIFS